MRIDEVIKLSNTDHTRAKEWIEKVYSKYPQVWQNNHVMTWGEGDNQQFAMFELVPSLSKRDAVEVKWFQAYPLRQGVGSRAMAELQRLAKEDDIVLTLYPWDKGQVSQAKLTKFYKGHGFKPTTKGSKNMFWEPEKLNESLSRIVYHYTNIHSALKILSSGQFELSSVLGSIEQSYAPKDHLYFLSTTRTRQGGYHDYIGNQAVLFVLDGNWFNNHYISRPVDYWENRNPSLAHHRKHEAEDRVFSREPTIPIDGVVAVHIYIDPKSDPEVRARARQALIAAKRRGIDTYFYTDPKAWRNFDQRNPGDVSLLTGPEHTSYRSYPEREYLLPWIELISAKNKSQLSKKADDLRYSLNYTYDKENAAQGLNTDLSNARKPSAGADRANAVKIIDYMRRNNVSTVKKLVQLLADKWKSENV
jgi:hypothetical protein